MICITECLPALAPRSCLQHTEVRVLGSHVHGSSARMGPLGKDVRQVIIQSPVSDSGAEFSGASSSGVGGSWPTSFCHPLLSFPSAAHKLGSHWNLGNEKEKKRLRDCTNHQEMIALILNLPIDGDIQRHLLDLDQSPQYHPAKKIKHTFSTSIPFWGLQAPPEPRPTP